MPGSMNPITLEVIRVAYSYRKRKETTWLAEKTLKRSYITVQFMKIVEKSDL
jgi:hypothetical protein